MLFRSDKIKTEIFFHVVNKFYARLPMRACGLSGAGMSGVEKSSDYKQSAIKLYRKQFCTEAGNEQKSTRHPHEFRLRVDSDLYRCGHGQRSEAILSCVASHRLMKVYRVCVCSLLPSHLCFSIVIYQSATTPRQQSNKQSVIVPVSEHIKASAYQWTWFFVIMDR